MDQPLRLRLEGVPYPPSESGVHSELATWRRCVAPCNASLTGICRHLLITVPPRHLKWICAAVGLVAWLLGRDPRQRILVASYGADLATKHARDFRTVVEADWYRRLFPRLLIDPKVNRESETLTTAKGGRKAVSFGGPVTGFGADLLIVDDLMKAADAVSETERQRVKDYYEQTLFSRLNDTQSPRAATNPARPIGQARSPRPAMPERGSRSSKRRM
jgi:hypothetical protein